MSSVDPIETVRLARAFAAKNLPWFAPALFRCSIVKSEAVSVAAIDDHYNIYWNPVAVIRILEKSPDRKAYLPDLAFIWIHEISHVLRSHSQRRDELGATSTRWNCCADLEINDSNWSGTSQPKAYPPLLPKDFALPDGQLAEWYYRQEATKIPEQQLIDCGSGAHGQARSWELDENGQQLSDTEREVIRRSVAEEMRKAPGQIPGHWQVWIDQTLQPTLDWRQLLQQRLATAIATGSGSRADYNFRRPSRRQSVYAPVIVPRLNGQQRNQLAVVIDTSSSMAGQGLGQAIAEIYRILSIAHQTVTLVPCDATSYDPVRMESMEQLRQLMTLPGGGGTDLRVGITMATKLTPSPDCILVLTDGYTPYPTESIKLPLIFGIISASKTLSPVQSPPNPPWDESQIVVIPSQ